MTTSSVNDFAVGMEVTIDPECSQTDRLYGLNDDIKKNYLGKVKPIAEIDKTKQLIKIGRWYFHTNDIYPDPASQHRFDVDEKATKYSKAKFNLENLW